MKSYLKHLFILSFFYTSILANCSINMGDFYINEIHTWDNWVEVYAKNPTPVVDWSVKACTMEGNPIPVQVCEEVPFSYTPSIDGYFIVLDFTLNFHDTASDFLLYDDAGDIVNYFRVGRDLDLYPLQIAEANTCGLDVDCNIFDQRNNGQRDFARVPDGSCTWEENTGKNNNTKDGSNDGLIPPLLPVPLSYRFDAWDVFRSINDRNISTKISGQGFSLTLAALNETNDDYQDINATVCVQVVDQDNTNIAKSNWVKSLFQDQSSASVLLNVPSNVKNCGLDIVWKKDVDESCPLINETNSTVSSDNFALRPQRFETSLPSNVVAGTVFDINFSVKDNGIDYNEAVSSSFDVNANEKNALCKTGFFTPSISSGWQFAQGLKNLSSYYSEVGAIDINITENLKPCNLRFSGVDCDDQNISGSWNTDADLSIEDNVTSLRVLPHHFDINVSSHDFEDGLFTYLSKDLSMSSYADVNITAKNEQNAVIENYNTACYANSFSLDMNYTNVDDRLGNFIYIYENNDINSSLNSAVINTTLVISPLPKTFFSTDTKGSALIKVYYNFDRNASIEISPFDINITGLYVNDIDGVEGFDVDTGDSTFYYGRVRPSDIETTLLPVTNPLLFEVYDTGTPYTSGMKQSSLYWYVNKLHTGNSMGSVVEAVASSNTLIDNALAGYGFNYNSVLSGQQNFDIIAASREKATIHLKTQEWLWYVPSSFGSAYDDGAGTDCTMHPCFQFTFTIENDASIIQSGDFNGTLVPDKNRGDYQRTGVKVFR